MNKHEVKCSVLIALHLLLLLYIALTANILILIIGDIVPSAEAELILNLFLNFEKK